MKTSNIYVYSIMAIAIVFSISTLNNIQAQMMNTTGQTLANATNATSSAAQNQTAAASAQNQTAITSGQNQTMSKDAQALMTMDLPELKDDIMSAKEALSNGNIGDALTTITDVENQLLLLKEKPSFEQNFKQVKDALSKSDLNKALDELTKVQTGVIKAETDLFKAKLQNPQLILQGGDDDGNDGDGDGGDDSNN
ncbi:MAG TPA: hypothetical protein VFV86_02650 [Nitrososphaeraceae archaeon]|nr:hypothetical protein [Nitrososphaeraceae archaeon]